MSTDVYTGKDLITLDNQVLNDLANGTVAEITYPNNSAEVEIGKDGNAIVILVENGGKVECTLRVLVGNKTDITLNGKLQSFKDDPASYVGFSMKLTKKVGDGAGNVKKCIWDLQKGVVQKLVGTKTDTTGDFDQGVAIYNLIFTSGKRTIR